MKYRAGLGRRKTTDCPESPKSCLDKNSKSE